MNGLCSQPAAALVDIYRWAVGLDAHKLRHAVYLKRSGTDSTCRPRHDMQAHHALAGASHADVELGDPASNRHDAHLVKDMLHLHRHKDKH